MAWSPLFDHTHIIKGVPVDAEIELECQKCGIVFRTTNAYHIGHSPVTYADSAEQGRCSHSLENLKPTNNWYPTRDIHKQASDGSWVSLFDYSHIVEGVPIDAEIELQCRKCKTLFYTKNTYYIGYTDIHYANPEEKAHCNHSLKDLKPRKRYSTR